MWNRNVTSIISFARTCVEGVKTYILRLLGVLLKTSDKACGHVAVRPGSSKFWQLDITICSPFSCTGVGTPRLVKTRLSTPQPKVYPAVSGGNMAFSGPAKSVSKSAA